MAKKFTKRQIVEAFVKFIMENGPITHTALEARAQTKNWYTMAAFDKVMETIHRHPQITSSVRNDDVYYFKTKKRPKKVEPVFDIKNSPDYPDMDETNNGIHPIFYDIDHSCNCVLHASRDEILELKKRGEHARLCNLHPIQAERIDKLYTEYYERNDHPKPDHHEAPEQRSLLLAK